MRGLHICSLWCEAECQHGEPCEVPRRSPPDHPQLRGKRHYAFDGKLQHEWTGTTGRCTTSELPDDA